MSATCKWGAIVRSTEIFGEDVTAWAAHERANANRARQFIPFAALRGYEGLVEQHARVPEPRRELTSERADELTRVLANLQRGEPVRVTYYDETHCGSVCVEGPAGQVDPTFRTLCVGSARIRFADLIAVESAGSADVAP